MGPATSQLTSLGLRFHIWRGGDIRHPFRVERCARLCGLVGGEAGPGPRVKSRGSPGAGWAGGGQGAGRAKFGSRVSGGSSCRPTRLLLPPPSIPAYPRQALGWGRSDRFGLPRPALCWEEPPQVGPSVPPLGRPTSQTSGPRGRGNRRAAAGAGLPQGWGANDSITTENTVGSPPAPGPGHWEGAAETSISVCSTPTITCQHPSPKGPAVEFPSCGDTTLDPFLSWLPGGPHSSPLRSGWPPADESD